VAIVYRLPLLITAHNYAIYISSLSGPDASGETWQRNAALQDSIWSCWGAVAGGLVGLAHTRALLPAPAFGCRCCADSLPCVTA